MDKSKGVCGFVMACFCVWLWKAAWKSQKVCGLAMLLVMFCVLCWDCCLVDFFLVVFGGFRDVP